MRRVWPLAIAVSVGTHGALLAGVALQWGAQDFAPQARPEARLNITDQPVTASTAKPAALAPEAANAASPKGAVVGDAAIPQSIATPLLPQATVARPVAVPPATPAAALPADLAAAVPSPGTPLPAAALNAAAAAPAAVTGQPAPSLAAQGERGTASLAWTGGDAALDPVSLAAIQAFMQPGDLATSGTNAGQVRDGIAATLAAVPCARLQTSFDPETGSLDLRGHLPEDGLRAPVLAALQAQVGSGIPVTDRLRLLPRPQCQALTAIADVGLAQSTEQDTNPRVVGADTFVRDYSLTAGQRLVFDMTAPDYPAVIYVDYFDAAGSVLHMQPNDQVPAVLSPAKSTLAVGQDAPGVPALQLIVGPPYGQEIAVAFAASVPLYAGVRPTVEPAAPYLEFLKQAVAQARANTPDFKGEWVYFFVTTAP
ncbi:MAG: hypothetical protein V4712_08780 [Pseudomonadota bacterium]